MVYAPEVMRSRVVRGSVALLFLVGAGAGAAGPAFAGEDPEALIKQGIDLRHQGDDARAEVYIRRAYEIAETPRSAAQLGLVELALDRYQQAEQYLSEALASDDVWIAKHRSVLEKSRDMARSHLVRIEIADAPTDATVKAAGAKPVKLAADGVYWAAPGAISLTIEAPGRATTKYSRNLAPGEADKITMPAPAPRVTAPPPAPPPAPQPPSVDETPASRESPAHDDTARTLRITGIAVAATGLAAAAAGFVLWEIGGSKLHDIQNEPRFMDGQESWQTYDHVGAGLLIGGGVAAVGGAVLYLVGRAHDGEEAAEPHVSLNVRLGPDAQLFGVGGTF